MEYYEQRESGLWSVRFFEMVDGKQINRRLSGFATRAEAEIAYREYCENYENHVGVLSAARINTFDDLLRAYMEAAKVRIKASSYYTEESKIKTRILPFFSGKSIRKITPKMILDWRSSVGCFSYNYQKILNQMLSSIFIWGHRYYGLTNPMERVEPLSSKSKRKKEMLVWSREEFDRFIKFVDDETDNCLFRFLYVSGCRKGEALALGFDDISLEKGTVSINKNLSVKTKGKPYDITTTKNSSSDRTIEMPRSLLVDMLKLRRFGSRFVFGGDEPLADTSLRRRFHEYIELAGLPKIRLHDLRHSCTSYLISNGIPIVAVSKRLGHANVTQTLNTYSHMLPSDSAKILGLFDEK